MIHLELIFFENSITCGCQTLLLFPLCVSSCSSIIRWKDFYFIPSNCFGTFVKNDIAIKCGSFSELSSFLLSVCLSLAHITWSWYLFVYFWQCWVFVIVWAFSSCGELAVLSGCGSHGEWRILSSCVPASHCGVLFLSTGARRTGQ